jgi:hypothetical protein
MRPRAAMNPAVAAKKAIVADRKIRSSMSVTGFADV